MTLNKLATRDLAGDFFGEGCLVGHVENVDCDRHDGMLDCPAEMVVAVEMLQRDAAFSKLLLS